MARSITQLAEVMRITNVFVEEIRKKEVAELLKNDPTLIGNILIEHLHIAYEMGKKEGEKTVNKMIKLN